jgi:prepilin-type N-terminal cleavage/methylation domain-containing protein
MRSTLARAFTLIELTIVVVLIGVIYALAASALRPAAQEEASRWSLERLDTALRAIEGGYAKLVCEGDLRVQCRVIDEKGGEIVSDLQLFEEPPIAYYFDEKGYLGELKFPLDRRLVIERFENGAISDALIEYRGSFYRYYSLLRPAEVFANIEEARKSFDPALWIPQYSNEFFSEID